MTSLSRHSLGASLAAVVSTAAVAQDEDFENPFRPFDREAFTEHVVALGATPEQLERFRVDADDGLVARAADELLRAVVAPLGTAADLAEDGDPRAPLALLSLVQDTTDPYVRAHARYHAARAFLDADDPQRAVGVLTDYLRQDRSRTPLDAEAAFFYATALAEIPKAGEAAVAFGDYLMLFPDAPERFRAVAAQRKAELEQQFQNPLHEIADEMKSVERDLRKEETGDPVQTDQLEIVEKLQLIIEELEQQEKQSSGAPSGNSQSTSPASKSQAPEGASRVGTLHDVPGVADRWGNMKDRDREAIESEVATKLTGRNRKLVEKYFEKLNKGNR